MKIEVISPSCSVMAVLIMFSSSSLTVDEVIFSRAAHYLVRCSCNLLDDNSKRLFLRLTGVSGLVPSACDVSARPIRPVMAVSKTGY